MLESFRKEATALASRYPHIVEDFLKLRDTLRKDPITGSLSLGDDVFKIRMAILDKNKGKSAGARVIVKVKIIDKEVYLLSVFDKSEKENLTEKEIDRLLIENGLKK